MNYLVTAVILIEKACSYMSKEYMSRLRIKKKSFWKRLYDCPPSNVQIQGYCRYLRPHWSVLKMFVYGDFNEVIISDTAFLFACSCFLMTTSDITDMQRWLSDTAINYH